jgi:uncharacterized protein
MKMFLEILLLIIAVVVLIYLSFYFIGRIFAPVTQQSQQNQVCFGSNCFFVELAKTNAERDRGLSNRKELDKDKGMFFVFDKEGIYPFWMKNTLIPLDIIWIDSNNSVVFISQNVQPCKSLICSSVFPSGPAKYVLEVNAGISKEVGIKIGDSAELKIK